MDFPQYRKYKNGQSYFEILSENEFLEYKIQINKVEKELFTARILPDRNMINDMLYNYEDHWDEVEKEDLKDFLEKNTSE